MLEKLEAIYQKGNELRAERVGLTIQSDGIWKRNHGNWYYGEEGLKLNPDLINATEWTLVRKVGISGWFNIGGFIERYFVGARFSPLGGYAKALEQQVVSFKALNPFREKTSTPAL